MFYLHWKRWKVEIDPTESIEKTHVHCLHSFGVFSGEKSNVPLGGTCFGPPVSDQVPHVAEQVPHVAALVPGRSCDVVHRAPVGLGTKLMRL